ncbi:MAG: archease [Chlorobi bacterium]|nr:archease [Chlorobiota bacterium]
MAVVNTGHFSFIEHTADIGLEIKADSEKELFQKALEGFTALICRSGEIRNNRTFAINVSAKDKGALLVEWFNECIYLFEIHGFIPDRIKTISISRLHDGSVAIQARVVGDTYDPERHVLNMEVKAATYHNLDVDLSHPPFTARIFFDL